MILPRRYFAWRVALRLYATTLAVLGAVLFVSTLWLRANVAHEFSAPEFQDRLQRFDVFYTELLFIMFVIGAIVLAVPAYLHARPLGRLVQRARSLRKLDLAVSEPEAEAESGSEDPGEWADLDRALNRIHRDLRRQTEALAQESEELSALIGAVSDAIFAIDTTENPLFFNSQFSFLFRPQGAGGDRVLGLAELFRVPEVLQGYRDVLRGSEMRVVPATLQTLRHQVPRHFSISIAPLRARDGKRIEGAVGVFHDVTEMKQSEQIRIEFVGNASHELRSPLTNIKGYVDTLRDDLKQNRLSEAPAFIDVISKNVDRLMFLVNDLLDLSTLESGADLTSLEVSTKEVTEAALRHLESQRAVKKQSLVAHYGVDVVLADPVRLDQVIVNLVQNAIKYTPEGSRIDVIWEPRPEGVILRVKDDGLGVPHPHQARLFERFYRVDAGRSRDQGGTGLGLAIVKHIMIKHGGSVRLQSQPDEGAEFICLFPSRAAKFQ